MGEAGASGVMPGAIIRGNVVAYNGEQGIAINNLGTGVVEYNHFYENNIENYSNTWSAAALKIIATKNSKVRYNKIERTRGKATSIWFDISSINCEIVHNTLQDK